MKNIISLIILAVALSGCALLGGNSDYDSHTKARVEFKQSDDSRVVAQSEAIERMATSPTQTAEGAAYQKALGMVTVAMLKNQEYGENAPMTVVEGAVEVAKTVVPITVNAASNTAIAREGIRAAGSVSVGAGASVNNSLNRPTAVNIGGQNSAVSAQPGVVEQPAPIVVDSGIVPTVQ